MNVTFSPGELWELKTVAEIGKQVNNSFCAVRLFADAAGATSGQTTWTRHTTIDKEWILSLQINDGFTLDQKWTWATQVDGTIYLYDDGVQDVPFRWPRICIGSKSTAERNRVRVVDSAGDLVKLMGIRPVDYTRPLIDLLSNGLVHHVACNPQRTDGSFSETPKGVFWMPIFDPNYYEHNKGDTGLWIEKSALFRRLI